MISYQTKLQLDVEADGSAQLVAIAKDDKGQEVKRAVLEKFKAKDGAGPTNDPSGGPTSPPEKKKPVVDKPDGEGKPDGADAPIDPDKK